MTPPTDATATGLKEAAARLRKEMAGVDPAQDIQFTAQDWRDLQTLVDAALLPSASVGGERKAGVGRDKLYRMIDGFADFLTFDADQRMKMRSRVRVYCALAAPETPPTEGEGK